MEDLDAIVREFVAETYENLAQLEIDLVALEQEPTSHALVSSIFRTIHTVKGTCGFLGFNRLETLAHAGENLLSRWRDGAIDTGPEAVDLLLRMIDVLRLLLSSIDATGSDEVAGDGVQDVVEAVETFVRQSENPSPGPKGGGRRKAPAAVAAAEVPAAVSADPPAAISTEPPAAVAAVAPAAVASTDPRTLPPAEPDGSEAAVPAEEDFGALPRSTEETVRVGVDVLDSLMRQVGELVLSRNRLGRLAADMGDPDLLALTSTVRGVVNELQTSVMKTRMQPVSNAWAQLPRLVRDLSASLGKQVTLETSGGDTEIDRTLLGALRDPLIHVVRNAVDHGIEGPDERRAAGKAEGGLLRLRAYQEGGLLVLEATDDGRGIDLARIGARAESLGMVPQGETGLNDSELIELLFRPGFSTAEAVSHISGRGVGMDVVRTTVEAAGGSVRITSRPGQGTTCRLQLPVTLAVTPSATVVVGPHRFVIPQADLRELVRLDGKAGAVEHVSGAAVYRLRDQLLPLVMLDAALELAQPVTGAVGTIAVLQVGDRSVGLVVDAVLDTEEVVVEPLDPRIGHLNVYSGAAILGDGRVSLVLDTHAIAQRAAPARTEPSEGFAAPQAAPAATAARRRYLVTKVNGGRRIALPMERVARLEDFDLSTVERMGGRDVVQYRGTVVPMLRLGDFLDRRSAEAESAPTSITRSVPAVVFATRTRTVALAVDEIVDIVDEGADVELDSDDPRIVGAAILQDRVTELLNVDAALLAADPLFLSEAGLSVAARADVA